MSKPLFSLCSLLAALLIATPALTHARTPAKQTKHATKATVKKTASVKKAVAGTKKTVLARKAIANARKGVSLTRVTARAMTLEHPGVQSSAVLILNQKTGEVLYQKNPDLVTPIASITKLMTAMVVLDAQLPLNELITISQDDIDTIKNTTSRLQVGTTLTRGELLLLALMSSENRAAAALSRAYPGGRESFIHKMGEKAASLGMHHSRFYDGTGLSPGNVSTPRELALMVKAAQAYPEIHHFSTSSEYTFASNLNGRTQSFHNTNPLVNAQNWDIGISKTGYINEAGRCLVMQATISDTPVVMVLMDSNGKHTRIGDAQRVRKWLESSPVSSLRAG